MSDQKIILSGPLLLVGCGKMGGALLRGWLSRGVPGSQVFVVDPAPRDLEDVQARGVTIATVLDQLPVSLQPAIVLLAIVVVLAGMWIAGGVVTDDFRASMALTALWFAAVVADR